MIDLSDKLKVSDENIDLIENIFQQGDARYVDNDSTIGIDGYKAFNFDYVADEEVP